MNWNSSQCSPVGDVDDGQVVVGTGDVDEEKMHLK
jgi:hypothetical protein